MHRILLLFVASCAARVAVVDPGPLTLISNDPTGIVAGCGQQPTAGYVYCRMTEGGDAIAATLVFSLPPASCDLPTCSQVAVLSPTGAPVQRIDAAKGATYVTLKWSDIIGAPTFTKDARGFWPFVVHVHWIDPTGNPQETVTDGELRLRVVSKDYTALGGGWAPSEFAWQWISGRYEFGMTTAGRVQIRRVAQ